MLPYSLSDLRLALENPIEVVTELNRLYYTRLRTWDYNRTAPNFFEQDWDNLIILDACRFDTLSRVLEEDNISLIGDLSTIESRGACTPEFLRGCLPESDLSDTVYVTGTTMLYRNSVLNDELNHNLHAVIDAWEDSIDVGEWGVSPDRMEQKARETLDSYPNKRLVVHFIQPHIPFIGEFGRKRFSDAPEDIWSAIRYGKLNVSDEELWQAYNENLREVLPATRRLLEDLPGKTVVTADHGQLIGDRVGPIPVRDYGHPNGIYCDELVKVPWLVHENGPRREIVNEDRSVEYDEKERDELDEKAKEHLENLGYM
ncbi:hypothetical protein [Halorhabdus sp. CUG00001]|uniref:hypothetical protein n=1 Tax=Halorhabdus sp. CUG00001 TaxID=2600297 RepID=UPI00131C2162|nr:hypothetical protein [Halorhabdus sp. CUG00001]